jgi:hypothetical protein
MNLKSITKLAISLPMLALLAGCSLPSALLVPFPATPAMKSSPLAHNVCVKVGAPGHMVFNVVTVTKKQLAASLALAMRGNGLEGQPTSCAYTLTGAIVHLAGPPLYLPYLPETFYLTIHYQITSNATGKIVFDRTIRNQYTQSYIFAPPLGSSETQQRGEERVFQLNIGQFETALNAQKFAPP